MRHLTFVTFNLRAIMYNPEKAQQEKDLLRIIGHPEKSGMMPGPLVFLWVISFFIGHVFRANAQQTKKTISISIPAGPLISAVRLLELNYKIAFAYEHSALNGYEVKAMQFDHEKLEVILSQLLRGTALVFEERKESIVIKKNQQAEPDAIPGITINGQVEDALSKEQVIGASIAINEGNTGTSTNNYGFYSITLPQGKIRMRLSHIGYLTIDTVIVLSKDRNVTFKMEPVSTPLQDVIITQQDNVIRAQRISRMSQMMITLAQIQSTPKLLGESDVMKTLQLLPGVQQGSDGTAALLVRGGSPDQNLILLDGAPLYSPYHFLGIFSTFNTNAIRNVDLYKGAFPARFGGRLSSIVDIATKNGNMNKIQGDCSIGLLASQVTIEGPVIKGKTSFVLSGRRTYPDLIIAPLMKNEQPDIKKFALYFYDANLKLQHIFSDNDRLFFSIYKGKDKFRLESTGTGSSDYQNSNMAWGNFSSTLRWNHIYTQKMFGNITGMVSDYRFDMGIGYGILENNSLNTQTTHFRSGIRDYAFKADFDYHVHANHTIRAGLGFTAHIFTPGITKQVLKQNNYQASLTSNNIITGTETDVYAEDEWTVTPKLLVNYGLHWSAFTTEGKLYQYSQPRLASRYLLLPDWALHISYTRMAQFLHLLAGNSITLPTDLWVPPTRNVAPQTADQYTLGLTGNSLKGKLQLSIEGYYKNMNHIIDYKEGESYIDAAEKNWSEKVTSGKGKAYGVELMAEKKTGRLTGWIAYTLSRTERTFAAINYGKTFPYKYDRTHDLKVTAAWKLTQGIEMSGCWIFQSAAPFTLPVGQYEGVTSFDEYGNPQTIVPKITARNNVRLEPYHRLDLSLSFIKHKKNGRVRTWNVSVFNVYNRKNPFSYSTQLNADRKMEIRRYTLMPLLPSISYNLKF